MADPENVTLEHLPTPAADGMREASDVGEEVSLAAWAEAARDVLVEIAGRYHAVVTHKELSALVQEQSGIQTSQRTHYWIGDVLARVASECASRGEPLLSALCVNAQGSVGDDYAESVRKATGEAPEDPDGHAAKQRLDSYRHFEAVGLPGDGGRPALTPRLAATRTRLRKAAAIARPVPICPRCQLALTANGTCDNCD